MIHIVRLCPTRPRRQSACRVSFSQILRRCATSRALFTLPRTLNRRPYSDTLNRLTYPIPPPSAFILHPSSFILPHRHTPCLSIMQGLAQSRHYAITSPAVWQRVGRASLSSCSTGADRSTARLTSRDWDHHRSSTAHQFVPVVRGPQPGWGPPADA